MLTQDFLKSIFSYDPKTGLFTRTKTLCNSAKKGAIAGGSKSNGYVRIKILKRSYQAHRLAFLYMEGFLPKDEVDHINGIKTDNRWDNIRLADKSENIKNRKEQDNNKLGLKNISIFRSGIYRVQISSNGICHRRLFKNIDDAILYAKNVREKLHGSFVNHGSNILV